MDVSELLRTARRAALISASGAGAKLLMFSVPRISVGAAPASPPSLTIMLATPIGQVGQDGVVLTTTDFYQAVASGDILWARLERESGEWIADFSAGEVNDDPIPDLILPSRRIFAGAFYRLKGSSVVCD